MKGKESAAQVYKTSSCRGGATERVVASIRTMRRRGHLPLFIDIANTDGYGISKAAAQR